MTDLFRITALLFAALPSFAAEKPHIVYLLADDMGYADAGFLGGTEIKTPHLDKLAASGAVLESFYVQPVCSPTRAALLTGRYATHTGVYTVVRPGAKWGLPLAERTLPQALREAGYQTAISGKWHLGEFDPAYRPTSRGFEQQYGMWFGAIDYFTHERNGVVDWHRNDQPSNDQGYSTHLIAREAVRVIRERDTARPLFLYVPFNAVHGPLQVPESYLAPYSALKGTRRIYAGMLAAMDEAIGQILAALDEKGMRDNTLIIFSSDNGGPAPGKTTDNGPLRAGKGTIYEGGIRVCALASWPGKIPAGTRIKEPLHAVDWYPTLLKIAGASTEQELAPDGKDILPVLTTGAKSPHEFILHCGTRPGIAALRVGDWKLVVHGAPDADESGEDQPARPKRAAKKNAPAAAKTGLFNLADDIGEKNDLATKHPEKLAELRAKLDALYEKAAAPGGGD